MIFLRSCKNSPQSPLSKALAGVLESITDRLKATLIVSESIHCPRKTHCTYFRMKTESRAKKLHKNLEALVFRLPTFNLKHIVQGAETIGTDIFVPGIDLPAAVH